MIQHVNRWKLAGLMILSLSAFPARSQEKNLKNIQKITFGGDNAEAYFSPNSNMLTLQVTNPEKGIPCDQIYSLNLLNQPIADTSLHLISTGKGRTTCSYFMPDGKHIIYASTHMAADSCPTPPKYNPNGKYLWAVFPEFDIFMADLNGHIVKQLTNSPGYDAEAVVSPDGKKIAFTSTRSGDLELWTMDIDGTNLHQVTHGLGYDGGSFFSHDSKRLVFRASRPSSEADVKEYKDLLAKNLVAPVNMEIYTCNVDGSNLKQITHLGKANWAPFFHPSDTKIIFASNHHSTHGYDFQLYMVDTSGENLQQVTYKSEFNAFPMFSPDGKKLAFSSNRLGNKPHETNVFVADWVEGDPAEVANKKNLQTHLQYLASDALEGRLTGSKGEAAAAAYIEKQLKALKLKPYTGKSYEQSFTYKVKMNPHDTAAATGADNSGKNVIAYLDNKAKRTIVIGAHYDHLGRNEHNRSSEANATGQIHNGADDNASGVAGVLELARMFSTNKEIEPANYIFAFFSGEEDGLIGSKHMAETIKSLYPNVSVMINLDMIGRLDSMKNITMGGIGTNPNFYSIMNNNKPAGYNLTIDSTGVGPSDYTSFYLKDIPVISFFTGTHSDYHKPSDDENKINYTGLRNIVDYVFRVSTELSAMEKVEFVKTKTNSGKNAAKYKVTLGIMPDYTDHGDGLHVDGVTDGRPAQAAGIQSGDIITKIGDCPVKEVYSYMECLSKIKAGDQLPITFIRNGKTMKAIAKF